jgi:HK97 family phage portal protein
VVLNRLFEQRSVSSQSIFAGGDDVMFGTLADTAIDSKTVFEVNAVYSAVALIANSISTLPLDVFTRVDGQRQPYLPRPEWVTKPDVAMPRVAFYNSVIVSLLIDGNVFVRVFSDSRGRVLNLVVLNPRSVIVTRNAQGLLMFQVEGEPQPLTSSEVLFIPDVVRPGHVRGVSRVEALKENFGLALALEKFAAQFLGNGTNLQGVIEFPGQLSQEQADNLRESFDAKHRGWRRGHRTGILSGGASFKTTQVDPQASQNLEARRMAVEDVARAFNIPGHLLNIAGTMSYASVEANGLQFLQLTILPIVQKLEEVFSTLMSRYPSGENAFVKFNVTSLIRADVQTRTAAYSTMVQMGAISLNEVRRLEELPDIDDPAANNVRVPLANVNIDAADLVAEEKKVKMATQLVLAGYDPAEALAAVGLQMIRHTGLPSVQLQGVAQIDAENPDSVYEVE